MPPDGSIIEISCDLALPLQQNIVLVCNNACLTGNNTSQNLCLQKNGAACSTVSC